MTGTNQQYALLTGEYPALSIEAMQYYASNPIIKMCLPWYIICARAKFLGHSLTLEEIKQLCEYDQLPEGVDPEQPCQWTVGQKNQEWPCDQKFRPLKSTIVQVDGSLLEKEGKPVVRGGYVVVGDGTGHFMVAGPFCQEHIRLARRMVPGKLLPGMCLAAASAKVNELNRKYQEWERRQVALRAERNSNARRFRQIANKRFGRKSARDMRLIEPDAA